MSFITLPDLRYRTDDFIVWEEHFEEFVWDGPEQLSPHPQYLVTDDGLYVYSTGNNVVGFSSDGVNWVSAFHNLPSPRIISYSDGVFVAGGTEAVWRSTDGVNFSKITVTGVPDTFPPWSGYPFEIPMGPLSWGEIILAKNGTFVMHGTQGSLLTGTNGGTTWSCHANISRAFGLPFPMTIFNNLFYAYNSGCIRVSSDGINWAFYYPEGIDLEVSFPFDDHGAFVPMVSPSPAATIGQYTLYYSPQNSAYIDSVSPIGFALSGSDLYSTEDGINWTFELTVPSDLAASGSQGIFIAYDEYSNTHGLIKKTRSNLGPFERSSTAVRFSDGSWDVTEYDDGDHLSPYIFGSLYPVEDTGWHVGIRSVGQALRGLI